MSRRLLVLAANANANTTSAFDWGRMFWSRDRYQRIKRSREERNSDIWWWKVGITDTVKINNKCQKLFKKALLLLCKYRFNPLLMLS